MNVHKLLNGLTIIALLLVLLTWSLTGTQAAEPLKALRKNEAGDGPPEPDVLSAPLSGLGGISDSALQGPAADAENVEFVGHIGGLTVAVFVAGDYAYVGEGGALTILDISDPAALTVVGKAAPLRGVVEDVYVSGDTAYVANAHGLETLDVSDPGAPVRLGRCETPGAANGVAVVGTKAYITDSYDLGLRVVDVSDPTAPAEVSCYDIGGYAYDVAATSDTIYVADGESGLRILDVSNPSAPIEIGTYDTPGSAKGVALAGNTAYVADNYHGLRILDVSNPSAPTEIGAYDTPWGGGGRAQKVTVAGSMAYLATEDRGLRVVDVSDTSAPVEVGAFETSGKAMGVAKTGSTAYVADHHQGLRAVDVSNPSTPAEIGSYNAPWGTAHAVAAAGNISYVITASGEMRVLDVSNPSAPEEIAIYDTGSAYDVVLTGSTAYVAGGEIRILDVSDPEAPLETGSYDVPGYARGVALKGNTAFVADQSAGLRVVDVSNALAPMEIGSCNTPGAPWDVAVDGNLVTIADGRDGGLRILDISDPSAPTHIGSHETRRYAYGVAMTEGIAFVAEYGGLAVVDISDPGAPVQIGSYGAQYYTHDVVLDGNLAYFATGDLRVVDVSDPSAPIEVGACDTPGNAKDVAVDGRMVYIADESAGVMILRYTGPGIPVLDPIANPDDDDRYTVDWSAVAGAASYTLEEDDNVDFNSPATRYTGGDSEYTASGQPAGTWYYRVKASNAAGDSDWSNVESVTVASAPTAAFTANPTSGSPPLNVSFTDQSTGSITEWSWTFGDGDGSATQSPSHTYDAAGVYTVSLTVSGPRGSDTETKTDYIRVTEIPPDEDDYEPDDTCDQASVIVTDGTVQRHTFHQHADKDWVSFDATAGTTYLIEAQIPADSPADLVAELYDQCAALPIKSQDHTFSPAIRLQFAAPISGRYYLKLLNHTASAHGPDVAYHLSVRALSDEPTPGALVLVAGRLREDDDVQPNIHHVTDAVRHLFLAHGYDDSRITYLATDAGLDGWDALPTATNLEAAITGWAPDKVGPNRPFTLYLMDHGNHDRFYLDDPRGETVGPQDVDGWLDDLEATAPGVKVNVIVEACYSGSFIDPSAGSGQGLTQSVSKPGRVVIASTGAWQSAYASDEGAIFSDHFVAALEQDESLYASFQTARWAVQATRGDMQTPWLDDDGDGLANESEDGAEAARRGFSFAGTLAGEEWPPYVVQATGPSVIDRGEGVIQAEVRDNREVRRVWAVIYPPSYEPPEPSKEIPQEDLPTIVLRDQGGARYSATYTGFDEIGTYRVVIHAEDDDLTEARPLAIDVRTGWPIYLPVMMRES